MLVGSVALHGALILTGLADPHKRFGFRPFNESDTWQAEIVRVTADGQRLAIEDGSWVYEWNDLVGAGKLQSPGQARHAAGGARSAVDLMQRALDWLVENTPADLEAIRYEATVTFVHNRGVPTTVELVGAERMSP